jgi:hypothetical protein
VVDLLKLAVLEARRLQEAEVEELMEQVHKDQEVQAEVEQDLHQLQIVEQLTLEVEEVQELMHLQAPADQV